MTVRRVATLALLAGVLVGCRGESTPDVAAEVAPALALFELAQQDEPGREVLARVIDDSLLEHDNPALLDALELLREASGPEVVALEPLPGLGRVAIDVSAALPGQARASYGVQTAPVGDGSWRVVWFRGPGVSWPQRPVPRRPGPASSAPPDG